MNPLIKRPFVYNFRSRDRRFNKTIEPSLYTSKNVLKRENKREYWGPNSSNNTLRKQRNNATSNKATRNNATRNNATSNNATSNNATRKKASNATPVTRKRRNAIFGI